MIKKTLPLLVGTLHHWVHAGTPGNEGVHVRGVRASEGFIGADEDQAFHGRVTEAGLSLFLSS